VKKRQGAAPEGGALTLTDETLFDGSLAKKIKIPNLPEKPKKAPKTEPAA
jgi:NADH-quinone oxidoreductase subunit E